MKEKEDTIISRFCYVIMILLVLQRNQIIEDTFAQRKIYSLIGIIVYSLHLKIYILKLY